MGAWVTRENKSNSDMNVIQTSDEIENSAILFIILGAMLFPAINSVDTIFLEASKRVFTILPIEAQQISSVIFHGLVLFALGILLFRLLQKTGFRTIRISLKTIRITGFIFALLILISTIIRFYNEAYDKETIELSKIEYVDIGDLAYLTLVSGGVTMLMNILLFCVFLVIVLKGGNQYREKSL